MRPDDAPMPLHWPGGLLFGAGAAHLVEPVAFWLAVLGAAVGLALTAAAAFRDGWFR